MTCIRSWVSPWEVFEARAFLQAVACYHYGIDFINQYVVTTMCGLHAALNPCTKQGMSLLDAGGAFLTATRRAP
jgi:hypothetical protein